MNLKYLLITSLLSVSVYAQDESDGSGDSGSFNEEYGDFYGDDDFVSIATGIKQPLHKAPAVATVITAKKIREMGAMDLDDVLSMVPGLYVNHQQSTDRSEYILRGIYGTHNPQVLVMVNGLPITNLFTGNRSQVWGGMPVAAISRIEVIRGPGSAVYGADAFSGIINIIMKNSNDINGTIVTGTLGSFSTKDFSFSHGASYDELSATFVYEHHSTDGFKKIIEVDAQTFYDSLFGTNASNAPGFTSNYRNNNDFRVELGYGNWLFRAGEQDRIMGAAIGVTDTIVDPSVRLSSIRWNADLSYKSPNVIDNLYVEGIIGYFHASQEMEGELQLFPPGADIGLGAPFPDGVYGSPEVWEEHYRANVVARYEGVLGHVFSLGLGYVVDNLYKVQESKNFAYGPDGVFIVPGSPVVDVTDTPYVFLQEGERNNKFIFLQDVWSVASDWELTAGVRADDYSDFGATVNPRFAIVNTTTLNLTTKLLYGQAFRAPAYVETKAINNPVVQGNPELTPEDMESLELVFDYHPNSKMKFTAGLFKYKWENIIRFVSDIGASTKTAQNVGKQNGYGVELEFELAISDGIVFSGNYALQYSENELTNEYVPYVPRGLLFFSLNYQINSNTGFYIDTNWVNGRKRATDDPRDAIDNFNITNLTYHWHPAETDYRVRFIVKNLFNQDIRYPTPNNGVRVGLPNDYPHAGRNFVVELSYTF